MQIILLFQKYHSYFYILIINFSSTKKFKLRTMKLSVRAGRRTRWRESWNRPKPIWTPRPERLRTWWAVLRTTRATSPNWSNKWKSRRWDSYLTSHCVVIDDIVFWSSVKNRRPIAYTHLKMFFRNRMYEKFIHMFYISYMDGFLFFDRFWMRELLRMLTSYILGLPSFSRTLRVSWLPQISWPLKTRPESQSLRYSRKPLSLHDLFFSETLRKCTDELRMANRDIWNTTDVKLW